MTGCTLLKPRAVKEAYGIFNSHIDGKRDRTHEQILDDCIMGHCTELFFIKNGYKDNDQKYMDVFDRDSVTLELKTAKIIENELWSSYQNEAYYNRTVRNTLTRCKQQKIKSIKSLANGGDYNYAERLGIYIFNGKTTNLHNIYDWDGVSFKSQYSDFWSYAKNSCVHLNSTML